MGVNSENLFITIQRINPILEIPILNFCLLNPGINEFIVIFKRCITKI